MGIVYNKKKESNSIAEKRSAEKDGSAKRKKAKKTGLHVIGPDMKEGWFQGGNERYRYIQIPEQLTKKMVREDIKRGAAMFTPILREENESRYTLIQAGSCEEGLTAVSYLIGLRNSMKESKTDSSDKVEMEEYDCEDDFEDAFGLDVDEWYRDRYTAGVIELQDLIKEYHFGKREMYGLGMDGVQLAGVGDLGSRRPYWLRDNPHNLVVVKRYVRVEEEESVISNLEVEALRLLQDIGHVYYLLIDETGKVAESDFFPFMYDEGESFGEIVEEEKEEDKKEDRGTDLGICKFLIEYTADHIVISSDDNMRRKYHNKIFEECLRRNGLQLSGDFPIELALGNIEKIVKRDGSFADSTEKILRYIRYKQKGKKRKVISIEDFTSIGIFALAKEKEEKEEKREEDHLIGMEDVKEKLESIVLMMKYERLRKARKLPGVHFHNVHLFEGAPGTAKTTMAKLLGRKMQKEKLLKGGRFIALSGAELKGKFVGHTAPKIHKLFQDYDVIFIDEAYALSASSNGEPDIFSQEALAQLAIELESHATDKLVIFAGYGGKDVTEENNKMKGFLDANPGIRSRINTTVTFASYSPKEMLRIVHGIAEEKGYHMSEDADGDILRYFIGRVKDPNFGNGREARSLFEACELALAKRVMRLSEELQTDQMLTTIEGQDVRKALAEKENEFGSVKSRRREIGFSA